MRLHVVIQGHAREMVGWLQVVIMVGLAAVVIVRRGAGRAAAAVVNAVDAVLEEVRARGRPFVTVIVVRGVQMLGLDGEFT